MTNRSFRDEEEAAPTTNKLGDDLLLLQFSKNKQFYRLHGCDILPT